MYPDKDKAQARLKTVTSQLELLYDQRKCLDRVMQKLENEKTILHRLLGIYRMEDEDEQQSERHSESSQQ